MYGLTGHTRSLYGSRGPVVKEDLDARCQRMGIKKGNVAMLLFFEAAMEADRKDGRRGYKMPLIRGDFDVCIDAEIWLRGGTTTTSLEWTRQH